MTVNGHFSRLFAVLSFLILLPLFFPRTASAQTNYAAAYNFVSWIGWPGEDPYVLPFAEPMGVAVDAYGTLYVSGYELITFVTLSPQHWQAYTLAGDPGSTGTNNGTYINASFSNPLGVAVDNLGNVFVADSGNNEIRQVSYPDGTATTLAGSPGRSGQGSADGNGGQAQFDDPSGVAVDADDNVYVADTGNNTIREISPDGEVTTLAGTPGPNGIGSTNGLGSAALFNQPEGVAVDSSGNIYVADTGNSEIREITPDGLVTTLAGDPNNIGSADGIGGSARFNHPVGLTVDALGYVYVADTGNDTIRKISPSGEVTTIAGLAGVAGTYYDCPPTGDSPTTLHCVDGKGSAAMFNEPTGVAVDSYGTVYVADTYNAVIRLGVPPIVQTPAIEVTQTIQDWNNSVPLIQGKETYVRVHLQVPPPYSYTFASGITGSVTVADALLYGTGPDGPLPGSPLLPLNNPLLVETTNAADPDIRGSITNTLNFRLPDSWLDYTNITLQFAWPWAGPSGVQGINTVPPNCAIQVSFVPGAVPNITFLPVSWTDGVNSYIMNSDILDDYPDRVLSCFPAPRINSSFFPIGFEFSRQPTLEEINKEASELVEFGVLANKRSQIYHAVVRLGGPTQTLNGGLLVGLAAPPILFSSSFFSSSFFTGLYGDQLTGVYGAGGQTVSHEISHNLGLQHDLDTNIFGIELIDGNPQGLGACLEFGPEDYQYPLFQPFDGYLKPTLGPMTNGDNSMIYGLDTLTYFTTLLSELEPVVSPTNYSGSSSDAVFDLMSYCYDGALEGSWPSSVTYLNLYNRITNLFAASPQPLARSPRADVKYLIVRGRVDFNAGTAQFSPCLPWSASTMPPSPAPGTNFLLEALDTNDDVVESSEFTVDPDIVEQGDTNLAGNFFVPLPADPSINTLQLSYNGRLLTTLTAPPHAPAITLTEPNGGQIFSTGNVNIAWSGADADSLPLTYTVQYSPDGGVSWTTLAIDWTGQSLSFSSAYLGATTHGLIRVIAGDGFNSAVAQSASIFTVQPHAPSVRIRLPKDGSIFIGNQQLFLDASASDMQDGLLSGTNIQWYSSRDGLLGTGENVTFNAIRLSEGYHTITATAIDSAGLTNAAVTHLWELRNPLPQLSIAIPRGQSTGSVYWAAFYTNYVLQSSPTLSGSWTTLTSLPKVSVNQQFIPVSTSSSNRFFRLSMQ